MFLLDNLSLPRKVPQRPGLKLGDLLIDDFFIVCRQIWSGYQPRMPLMIYWLPYIPLTPSYCGTLTLVLSYGRRHSLITLSPSPLTPSIPQILHVRKPFQFKNEMHLLHVLSKCCFASQISFFVSQVNFNSQIVSREQT